MQSISVFEMIKIGIGPSSSHTMGPWTAAEMFLKEIDFNIDKLVTIYVHLYGSLAKTGLGHGTDVAIMLGLSGQHFTDIDTKDVIPMYQKIKDDNMIVIGGTHPIPFVYEDNIIFDFKHTLAYHPNGMTFIAKFEDGVEIDRSYYSVGGGFVATEYSNTLELNAIKTPYPCHKAIAISEFCHKLNIGVSDLVYLNEKAWRSTEEIDAEAMKIWHEIKESIFKGVYTAGILPGGLNVVRRASSLNKNLLGPHVKPKSADAWIELVKATAPTFNNINKWVTCFALAVNEENASFGRIITAPTNGASGVIPAVIMYAWCFIPSFEEEQVIRFILTAGEIGTIFKKNATISAAMGGCQAEIGVSSAMAAAGLTECLGGEPDQVLMASEIAMEHHLGMTCDPIGGLVQIPCIERNSMGAIKAITASNIALEGDPEDARVKLDDVIQTMWETAQDMNSKYKETSEGGLAVQIPVNLAAC